MKDSFVNRREFLHQCAVATAACAVGVATARAQSPRPNIVFIYTDDQAAWTIGALGGPDAQTPHLDRLVAEGGICANAFVTTPVCSPSRAGLLSSRYGTEVGITDWIKPVLEQELGLEPNSSSWVRELRDAGYATGLVGKWHLGLPDRFHPSAFGYQSFAGFRSGGSTVENPELEIEGETKTVPGLTVDVLTDLGIEFIRAHANKQPFMLSIHHRSPHRPWPPHAAEDEAAYEGKKLTVPNPDYPDLDVERVEGYMRDYLESVSGVDRNVGRVLAVLDELKLSDNTIVIFTSDHGYNVGHHGLMHKGNATWITKAIRGVSEDQPSVKRPNMFDTSLQVPLIVRWPGHIAPGAKIEQAITNLDWYPTLLALAGVARSATDIRGRDFSPLLLGKSIAWDNTFYGEYSMHHTAEADLRMIRTPEWKLVLDLKNPGKDELYNLAKDPGETRNLIDVPESAAMRDSLREKIAGQMRAIKDPLVERMALRAP